MSESVVITPDPPLNKGADYTWLKAEGTRLVQVLSGAIWTDYNEHDPGVTTLEQLCYALTELSYRAGLPLDTLLIDAKSGRIDTRRQALFIPRRILPSAPLTQNDYRKLIVDRVPGVANVWLTPHRAPPGREDVQGLYDIAVYAPDADPCGCDDSGHLRPEVIRERARRVYCHHRALCEDVNDIRVLEPLRAVVSGVAVIDNSLAAEAILARILYNLGNFLAPELRRVPLDALTTAGLDAAAIFNGPLLRHGFISDDQLAPKAKAILLPDVVRVMVHSAGVMSVRDVTLRIGDQVPRPPKPSPITVPETQMPRLETRPVDGRYSIRLLRNGIEVKPDPVRVQRELDRLWNDYRRTYPLARQYVDHFSVPQGKYRDVEPYYSIQNQYANVYGINSFGLPGHASASRKAQAKQLKGYLLPFEQLLADFFAQLANVRSLYTTDNSQAPTYFSQYLDRTVPDVGPLLQPGYREGLKQIINGSDPVVARRNRFLDLLLAMYAERLDSDLMPFLSDSDDAGERLIRAKIALLTRLVAATRDRAGGFDYLASPSSRNIAGMTIRSRIELGMPPLPHRPLGKRLEEIGLELAEDEVQHTIGTILATHGDHIQQSFTPLELLAGQQQPAEQDSALAEHATASLRGQRTSEAFLRGLAGGNVRLGTLPGDTMISAACQASGDAEWRLVGKYANLERALAVLALLIALASDLIAAFGQLYIVEHVLLRTGRRWNSGLPEDGWTPDATAAAATSPDGGGSESVPFSFTISAVVLDAPSGSDEAGYRAGVAEVIRRNTPAHIVVEYCFLRPHRMAHFEVLYNAWCRAMRLGDRHAIAETSRRLRLFLEKAAAGSGERADSREESFG